MTLHELGENLPVDGSIFSSGVQNLQVCQMSGSSGRCVQTDGEQSEDLPEAIRLEAIVALLSQVGEEIGPRSTDEQLIHTQD